MKVKCIDLALAHDGTNNVGKSIDCMHQFAWVIDNALSEEFLAAVNDFRQSLPLDDKRPTVKRRFFSSAKQCPDILDELKGALVSALSLPTTQHGGASANVMLDQYHPKSNHPTNDNDSLEFTIDHQKQLQVHILSYMRFLEYNNIRRKS